MKIKKILVILAGVIVMFGLFAKFSKPKYQVDYAGSKSNFSNAKDSYVAGCKVKMSFGPIATDTDYEIYVDGQLINFEYNSKRGTLDFQFVMPDHDINIFYISHNSMVSVIEEHTTLVKYSKRSEAVEGDGNYVEYSIKLINDEYYLDVDDNGNFNQYQISEETYKECYEKIEALQFDKWADKKMAEALDGVSITFFYLKDGKNVQVHSGAMPKNGEEDLHKALQAIQKCIEQ